MYCRNCGKELPENSKFCNNCGAPQEKVEITKTEDFSVQTADKKSLNKNDWVSLLLKILFIIAPVLNFFLVIPFDEEKGIIKKAVVLIFAVAWFISCLLIRKSMKQAIGNKANIKWLFNNIWSIISGIIILISVVILFVESSAVNNPADNTVTTVTTTQATTEPTTEAPIAISASKLVQAYIDNEVKADTIYDDKTVIVSGRVNRIEQTDYLFMENELIIYVGTGEDIENCLRCYVSTDQKEIVAELEQGDKITLTGRCVGLGSAYFNLKCVNIYDGVISN